MNYIYGYKYIPNPKLFNTGFLPNTSESRLKQGLLPQQISNDCQFTEPGANLMSDMARVGGVCNNCYLYPFYSPSPALAPGSIPKGCQCTRYVLAPDVSLSSQSNNCC